MRQDGRRGSAARALRWIGLALLAAVFLYVVAQCFVIFRQSYKTETAIRYTMSDSVTLDGVVAYDAVPVEGTGNLGYLVQDGERVSSGTVLAEYYTDDSQGLLRERLDRLQRTIDLLSKSQNSDSSDLSVLTNQTRQALYNLLDKLDSAEYSGIADAEDDFCWHRTVCRSIPAKPTAFLRRCRRCRRNMMRSMHS